jgi:hypothetical protein
MQRLCLVLGTTSALRQDGANGIKKSRRPDSPTFNLHWDLKSFDQYLLMSAKPAKKSTPGGLQYLHLPSELAFPTSYVEDIRNWHYAELK